MATTLTSLNSLTIADVGTRSENWAQMINDLFSYINTLEAGTAEHPVMKATLASINNTSLTWGQFGVHANSATVATAVLSQGHGSGNILELNSDSTDRAGDRLVVTSMGLMGLGETAPLGKLHVMSADSSSTASPYADELVIENSTHGGISILTPNNVVGAIYFGDPESNESGSVQYDHTPNALFFHTAGAERMRLTATGLGIGIAAPEALLHVSGGSGTVPTLEAATVGIFQRNASTYQDCAISIIAKANANSIVNFSDEASENPCSISYDHGGGNLSFRANANTYWVMSSLGGFICGSPTGGDKGAGTINAVAVWDNGVDLGAKVTELETRIAALE